ncbi:MAG: iron-containing alcohol dehydrogenase [Pseudomonadota bacterium]
MTLITYPTRVHFSEGVLEEALRSELEAHDFSRPLLLCEEEAESGELAERMHAGLPRRTRPIQISIGPADSKYDTAERTFPDLVTAQPDVIVPFGSARAIVHARKVRHYLLQRSPAFGTTPRPLDLFAVPGVDGLPNPCRTAFDPSLPMLDAVSRSGLPRIVICDPSVAQGATNEDAAGAAMDAFSRCLEAYLSDAYNPPADGIAVDGLIRALASIRGNLDTEDKMIRRELMAANLNARLAQQKGIGPTQLLSDILREPHGNRLKSGPLARVLLPAALGGRTVPPDRQLHLNRILDLEGDQHLDEEIDLIIGDLPFAGRLSDLGLTRKDIVTASAQIDEPLSDAVKTTSSAAMSIMEAVL